MNIRLYAPFIALGLIVLAVTTYVASNKKPFASISFNLPGELNVTDQFTVPLKISTNTATNAAEFYFHFPANLLSVETIDQGGSFYSLWVKDSPAFDNNLGEIYLAGGLPTPGFRGRDGLVATVKFKVKTTGSGIISLDETKSRILANDGLGSRIPATFKPITFTIN